MKILLVDDEPRNLDVLESILESPEYTLVRAATAERALMLLLDGVFAVIVLDIQMPNMSGIELAGLIKQRRRTQHVPIIFLTAYFHEDKDVLQGYGTGAVDYLTKPVNPQILRSKIAVFVELFRKTQAIAGANALLEHEIGQRQRAEESLRRTNNELEARVAVRTAELVRVNQELLERERALRESQLQVERELMEQKRIEAALRAGEREIAAARDQALAASRTKDDFLARLSHELRTPLNPVLLLASEAARNPDLPPPVREDFELIAQNVVLEARLIDDLLDLTAITRGKVSLERRPVEIHPVLREALAMIRRDIDEKQLEVALQLDEARHVVFGDDMRLKQVFLNVIKNAVKFTPPCGRITIASSADPQRTRLKIAVADSGIGLTPEESARIFAAFTQGDHAANGSGRFGGLGLGLVISRTLVQLHAGSITASSAGRNQGSTFAIELPLAGANTASPPADDRLRSATAPAATAPRPLRVLLVEDHQPTCRALSELLVRRRYDVVAANTIADAFAAVGKHHFDFVISDVGLPDGNGCDLMAELRTRFGLRGVALTGYGMDGDVMRSQAAGFITHLTKPVSIRALDQALLQLVELTESRV